MRPGLMPGLSRLERQPVRCLFGVDRARAAAAAGVEREMVGDPRAGLEGRVARHELRQMVSSLRAVAEARQGHVRAELAALALDAAVARHGRDLLVQPVEAIALLDGGDQGARLLAARELLDAGDGDGEGWAGDVRQFLLEVAQDAALPLAREAERDVEVLRRHPARVGYARLQRDKVVGDFLRDGQGDEQTWHDRPGSWSRTAGCRSEERRGGE